jgi:hypothetical protein
MKIDRLETHDRLQHFKKDQNDSIMEGLNTCLKHNPLSIALQERSSYIYVFAHPRTREDGVKAMYWQPRLSKPSAQTNSYLFRVKSFSDECEIMWMIPATELWGQYDKGNVTESDIVQWSINQFRHNKHKLENPESDDLPDHLGIQILNTVQNNLRQDKLVMESVSAMLEREKMIF